MKCLIASVKGSVLCKWAVLSTSGQFVPQAPKALQILAGQTAPVLLVCKKYVSLTWLTFKIIFDPKRNNYLVHTACWFNQSYSVIRLSRKQLTACLCQHMSENIEQDVENYVLYCNCFCLMYYFRENSRVPGWPRNTQLCQQMVLWVTFQTVRDVTQLFCDNYILKKLQQISAKVRK